MIVIGAEYMAASAGYFDLAHRIAAVCGVIMKSLQRPQAANGGCVRVVIAAMVPGRR
ncbi:hypothetical protein [Rhodopseudomonas palustris]|uniref:hypothetical protein n=1 Tax=Rhodopseudomonas palustris TaxID=1076 RepID=UPI00163DCE91|nr:hypothetical protein [Rhodopseudomonas palustris]